jgi:pantetheine-phosphate adenylyltransferase
MTRKPIIGMYAGSFDPFTLGHLDVAERASKVVDKLIIAIGIHSEKKSLFDLAEKTEHLESLFRDYKNVSIASFSGLVVNFAAEQGATILVRGLRTEADFTYEMQMAMMNRVLAPNLQSIFIPSRQDLAHISSSLVKEVAKLGGDISSLVPKIVSNALFKKLK